MIMDIKLVKFEIGGNTMAKRKWSSEEVEEYRKEHNQDICEQMISYFTFYINYYHSRV